MLMPGPKGPHPEEAAKRPSRRMHDRNPAEPGAAIEYYLASWGVTLDGALIETRSSWLVPVRRAGQPAMLKVMRPGSDEAPGIALLRYLCGDGAVRVMDADFGALLMERAE